MLRFMLGVWLLTTGLFTHAQQPIDLYNSSTLVPDQSEQERYQAAPNALAKVFVRVSGSRDITKHAPIQNALSDAKAYLYEFEYFSTDEILTVDGVEYPAIRLLMKFSPNLIDSLLKNEQLPYWPANRPDVLLWAAEADGQGGQGFIDNDSSVTEAFAQTATERGVILVKPVFDLEDRLALPVSRLWALDATTIANASARYQTDAVLAGRFSPLSEGQWRGNFTLFYQGQEQSIVAYGENTEITAMNVFEQVGNYFSAIFASVIDNQSNLETVVLTVNNVDNFATYINLLGYLENLPAVEAIHLIAVEASQITMMLNYKGDRAIVFRTLALDKRLIEDKFTVDSTSINPALAPATLTATAPGTKDNPLQFIWQAK